MFQFKQDLPVQLDAFPVGVFNGRDVSLEEHEETREEESLSFSCKTVKT